LEFRFRFIILKNIYNSLIIWNIFVLLKYLYRHRTVYGTKKNMYICYSKNIMFLSRHIILFKGSKNLIYNNCIIKEKRGWAWLMNHPVRLLFLLDRGIRLRLQTPFMWYRLRSSRQYFLEFSFNCYKGKLVVRLTHCTVYLIILW